MGAASDEQRRGVEFLLSIVLIVNDSVPRSCQMNEARKVGSNHCGLAARSGLHKLLASINYVLWIMPEDVRSFT